MLYTLNWWRLTCTVFSHMLCMNGMNDVTTTFKIPSASAIYYSLHQSGSITLQPILHTHPPSSIEQTHHVLNTCFATAGYASKTAIHCTLNISLGALVFHRDMILNIPLITDLQLLHKHQQTLIDEQL